MENGGLEAQEMGGGDLESLRAIRTRRQRCAGVESRMLCKGPAFPSPTQLMKAGLGGSPSAQEQNGQPKLERFAFQNSGF